MLKDYLIVQKDALPDYFLKVVEARKLIETGACPLVSEAARMVGISRSTYYKYKDKVLEPALLPMGHRAVISMLLSHEAGALSEVLKTISDFKASVLTITQSLPVNGSAFVAISIDTERMSKSVDALISELTKNARADSVRLVALE